MKSIFSSLQHSTQPVINNYIAFIVPLTAALIICRAFPVLSFFYYAVPFILLFTFILYLSFLIIIFILIPNLHHFALDKRLKTLLLLILAFAIWAAVTSVWSSFPEVSISRSAYFLLMAIVPVLLGYLWSKSKSNDLFGFLLPANIIVIAVSLYSLIISLPSDAWTGGHGLGFKGYAAHQNTLASAIVFTIPAVLFPLLNELIMRFKNKDGSDRLPLASLSFYLLLFLLNLYFLLASVSRAGVLTLAIMILAFILLNFNLKLNILFLLILFSASVVLYYLSPSVKRFIFKTEETIGDRRSPNLIETIEAAKDGGLFGLGYGISREPHNKKVIGRLEHDGKVFIREKMISILALIEEVGVIGLGLFAAIIGYVFWGLVKVFKIKNSPEGVPRTKLKILRKESFGQNLRSELETAFMIAVFAAFTFHAQIEAWWVGVGSIEMPLFFLVLGVGAADRIVPNKDNN